MNARHMLLEKRQGISGRVSTTRILLGKQKGFESGRSRDIQINNQNEPQAHFVWYRRGYIVYSNKEQRWGGCSRSELIGLWWGGVMLMLTFLAFAHMVDAPSSCVV